MSLIDGIYWQNEYDAEKPKEKIPETNYQRVMRKTPEQFAEWLVFVEQRILERQPMLESPALYADWLDWLNSEAEE